MVMVVILQRLALLRGERRRIAVLAAHLSEIDSIALFCVLSNDLRDIQEAAEQGNQDCLNAVKAYAYGIKKYIGAYTAAMGGIDAVVFGGGIGRKSDRVRAMALEGLECLGVKLDATKNLNPNGGDDISADDSRVRIYVVDTNEEIVVARKAQKLLQNK